MPEAADIPAGAVHIVAARTTVARTAAAVHTPAAGVAVGRSPGAVERSLAATLEAAHIPARRLAVEAAVHTLGEAEAAVHTPEEVEHSTELAAGRPPHLGNRTLCRLPAAFHNTHNRWS